MGNYVHACFATTRSAFGRVAASLVLVLIAVTAAHAQYTVTAAWDRNSDSYTAGYRLYYGTASGSYEWSVDVGNQVSAPLNLSPGTYYFVVRGYSAANVYGPASNEVRFQVGATTPAPTAAIQASLQNANTALVNWQTTNATSATINGAAVALSGSTTITVTATTTFTIVARNASGATATASATVTVTGGGGGGGQTAPLAPSSMTSSVSGSRVTLAWRPPSSGSAPTEYLLDVGTRSGASNISRGVVVGNVLSVSGDLPRGRYYARVRARNAYGTSASSNQVSFRIGAQLASPTRLSVTWQGTQANLSWVAPAADGSGTPSGYVLEAGSAPGLSDVAVVPVGNVTGFSASVPSGIYYVRVRAVNDNGDSDPTPDLVVAPPGTAPAPTGLAASGAGSTVTLTWAAPAGETPRGYIIEAGTDSGLADIVSMPVGNVTRFTTTAPPGTYFVRVRAVNARGAGVPSNEIVVQR